METTLSGKISEFLDAVKYCGLHDNDSFLTDKLRALMNKQ